MTATNFENSVSPEMHEAILREFRTIEASENVRILFAIESGSRAWGFPSPDSDYDARFVYAHSLDWYLTIKPGRDVIELPIDGELDINGWDIRKALGLLMKPNPVVLEWLSSPIRYIWNDDICTELIDFSKQVAPGPACLHHYLNLGSRQWNVYIEGRELVNLKKYFYIVRPAAALRWIRLNPDTAPPMNFQELVGGIDLRKDLLGALNEMLAAKSRSKELGQAPRVPIIDEFIRAEFDWARDATSSPRSRTEDLSSEADALFRTIVKQSAPS